MPARHGPLTRWLPGIVFLSYLVGTVLLFYFGPWQYQVAHHGKLLAFLIASHAAMALGYASGARAAPRPSRFEVSPRALALTCIAVDLLLLFPTSQHNTGSWIPPLWQTLSDPGQAYADTLRLQHAKIPYANYFRIALAPLLASSIPLGIFYWRALGRWGRVAMVTLVVGTLAMFLSMGTNRGVGEWAALFPWFVFAGHASGVLRLDRRGVVAATALGLANCGLLVLFFGATQSMRQGSAAKLGKMHSIGAVSAMAPQPPPRAEQERRRSIRDPSEKAAGPAAPAEDELTESPKETISTAVVTTASGFTSYFTQGYYAVYLCLDEPFVPMWGIGHSLFLQRQAARVTGNQEIVQRSYPERIEARGWNAARSWATIYPWIASDVGFSGTIIVVFLIARLLALVWIDTLGGQNPWAVALLGRVLLMLYFFPANNRCLSAGEGVVSFWVLLLLWWLSRRAPGEALALSGGTAARHPPPP